MTTTFSGVTLTTMHRIPKTTNLRYLLTPSTRSNTNTSSIGDPSLEDTPRCMKILLTTHLLPQGLPDHPVAHHLPETPTTTTEMTMTISTFHHLADVTIACHTSHGAPCCTLHLVPRYWPALAYLVIGSAMDLTAWSYSVITYGARHLVTATLEQDSFPPVKKP